MSADVKSAASIHRAFLSLGSNLGDRLANLVAAVAQMREFATVKVVSSIYETEPWGIENQPLFLNIACEIEHRLAPQVLLGRLQDIERGFGRKREIKWSPRAIDIDILLFDNIVIDSEELTIPHSLLAERKFALQPLYEIASDAVHPVLGLTIEQLLRDCRDYRIVRKIKGSSLFSMGKVL